jgi:2,4-dienoyl-CoA reductase-like NADH-dependent reductase (Old Yellow Enzyme family)
LWVQLDHPGRQCPQMVCTPPLSPSDVQLAILGNFARPRPMDQGHIEEVIAHIIITNRLVKKAGFSGVKIHCAHGYLHRQFLSAKINQRQNQWGGR